ncbi:hypothetical protein NP603_02040 [Methylomonas sp. SURF-1]|uniref:DUF5615 domain-containing protein n=1 Tax=Methylomonas aurea TaxID=2952224 RepID=A0ABT1UCG1_9GAMM|nr:hypothetical protein [Methylomonas sp. SURF-1]
MKLLLDMNLSPGWLPVLVGAVVFTHDLDFGTLLTLTGAESPSVFQIRTQNIAPQALGPRAIGLLRRFHTELENGALVVADELREWVRLLPLDR